MGPVPISRERSNDELEELFLPIINDNDFLDLCKEEFVKTSFSSPPTSRDEHGEIVHEMNMSVYENVQIDRNNDDLTFVRREIDIIRKEETKNNHFSHLNLSNEKRSKSTRRRATIDSLVDEKHEFDSAFLERIVEQQIEAARRAGSGKNFQTIDNNLPRTETFSRPNFVALPILNPSVPSRSLLDHIESPKDAHLRRTRSMRQANPLTANEPPRRFSTIEEKGKLTTPFKSIRRQMSNRNSTASFNRKVSRGRRVRPLLLLDVETPNPRSELTFAPLVDDD